MSRTAGSLPVIAHIMPWAGIGGVEVATLRLVNTTRNRFRHVALVTSEATAVHQAFTALGIPVYGYTPPNSSIRHGLGYFAESRAVAGILRQAGACLVHFADMKAAEHNSLAALLAGCRQICHVRVSVPEVSLRNRLTYLPVQLFLFVSREAQQTFGMTRARHRSRVLYDAVEVPAPMPPNTAAEVRSELGVSDGQPVVGMIARISPQKDYRTLIAAAVTVLRKRPNTCFLLVGDNSNVDLNRQHYVEISADLERLGIRGSFCFTGHRTDISRLTTAMDFCVLVTHREGFPLSILESMSMGKAVVATDVGGIPEIIRPGENGFLVPHEDSAVLAKYVLHLIEHPTEARNMGNRAAALMREEYSPQRFADEVSAIYRQVLGSQSLQQEIAA